jgi:integrase
MSVKESPAVKAWLGRLGVETARQNAYTFKAWIDWLKDHPKFKGFTPDQLVEYQRAASNGSQYDVLTAIQDYIASCSGLRLGTKRTRYMVLRGFFLHSRTTLPDDPTFRVRGDVEKVFGELKPEEIRSIVLSCNKMYQAVFASMLMGGLDEASLVYWSNHGLEKLREDLKTDPDIITIHLPGRKRTLNAEPFETRIGRDAVDAVKRYLVERDTHAPRDGPIFLDQYGKGLTRRAIQIYWRSKARRVGVIKPRGHDMRTRTGKSPHELRDTFRTMWAMSGAAPHIAESMMGHAVDDLGYDKSYKNTRYVDGEYRKAAKWLNIFSSGRAYGVVPEDEMERLERELKELRAGKSSEMEGLKANVKELREMYHQQHNQLVDLMFMYSSLPPEMQEKALEKLKRVDKASHEELETIEREELKPKTP